jgi:hypothetical protein
VSDDTLRAAITTALAANDYTAYSSAANAWRDAQRVPTGAVETQDLASGLIVDGGSA